MKYFDLVTHIARINPAVYDAIFPRGPISRYTSGVAEILLNPQPLPPGPEPDVIQLEAVALATRVVHAALDANLRGENSTQLVSEIVDDWCATPWPRRWPWPGPGPRPDEGPSPDPWRLDDARIIGATIFASYASRLGEGELRTALAEGAEKLVDTVIHEQR